jgi:dolichol-phosphate mannosyltransferase
MEKYKVDIIVPIYNEGHQLVELLKLFEKKIKAKFNLLLCYDSESDDVFKYKSELNEIKLPISYVKNPKSGPCSAIVAGLYFSNSDCKIVYPADDFLNIDLIDKMIETFSLKKSDIVVASRFMKGGTMKGCPFVKEIFVRFASWSLHAFSSIPVQDASNGFRLFSKKLLESVKIESKLGFAYSLELLVKCERLKMNISELPAQWEERSYGSSNFHVFKWLSQYLKWYFYGLKTFWLRKNNPINLGE